MLRCRFARTAIALAIASIALPVSAQGTANEPGQTVTITASRTKTLVADIPSSMTVLDGAQLEKQIGVSSETFDALVKFVPGLETQTETSFDASGKGPQLRGRAASVLINGVPVNTLLRSSGFTLGLVDSYAIDRIEVNRGVTAAYGFGAPGGVISLQTRRGQSAETEFVVRTSVSANPHAFGDSLSGKAYVGAGRKQGGLDFYVGLAAGREKPRFAPDGEPIYSQDVTTTNFDGTLGIRLGQKGRLELSANLFRRNFNAEYEPRAYVTGYCLGNDFDNCPIGGAGPLFQATRFDDPESKAQYQDNRVLLARLTHEIAGQALDAAVYSMSNSFQYGGPASDFVDPPTIGKQRNAMTNDRHGLRTSLTATFGSTPNPVSLTYGIDYQRDELFRSNLQAPTADAAFSEDKPFAPPVALNSYALFAQVQAPWGQWVFSGGVRREWFRPESPGYRVLDYIWPEGDLPRFGATSLNFGAVYKLNATSEAYLGISQGIEVSELGRIMRDLASNDGVPADLARAQAVPAKTTQYELGYRSRGGDLRWSAAVFYIDAPLSAQADCSELFEPCKVVRQPEETWGLEATADWKYSSTWSFGGNFTWQNGSYVNTDGMKLRQTSDRTTPPRVNLYANWRPAARWETTLSLTHLFDRKPFQSPSEFVPFGLDPLNGNVDGYTTLDLAVGLEVGAQGNLSLGVENLLNKRFVPVYMQAYRDIYYATPAEGRRVTLSFNTRF